MSQQTETTRQAWTPLGEGAIARITRDVEDLSGGRRHRAGTRVSVECYVSPEESGEAKGYYWASSDQGLEDVCVPPDALEEVMSPAQAAARTLPTPDQVLRFIGQHTVRHGDGMEVYETQMNCEQDGTVSLVGMTEQGLRFNAVVSVLKVLPADF